jgi:hypothetical protein
VALLALDFDGFLAFDPQHASATHPDVASAVESPAKPSPWTFRVPVPSSLSALATEANPRLPITNSTIKISIFFFIVLYLPLDF